MAKRAYSVLPTLYGYIRTSRRLIAGEPGNDPDTQRLHALGIQTFFCDTRSPWQKGGVENAIGRLRRPLPRKTRLVDFSEAAFTQIIQLYNNTRVDSGRGQNRTLRGMEPVECAIDGWS